jgi:hypothetical protein
MIPPVFLIPPALSLLFAARCAAVYWRASAELWEAFQEMTASADIVPFPSERRARSRATGGQRPAEILLFER